MKRLILIFILPVLLLGACQTLTDVSRSVEKWDSRDITTPGWRERASGAINIPEATGWGRLGLNSNERYKASNAKLRNLSRDLGDSKNIPGTDVFQKGSTPAGKNTSYTAHEPTKSVSETADARIKRLEAEAKKLKIQKLEQEIARLRGGTATQSASVHQRQAPVRRTPVNTRRHFADDYSCGPDDMSCWENFVLQNPASKRAIKGGSDMTETQFFLTSKILFSRLNSKRLANKRGLLALYDAMLKNAIAYESGRISKEQLFETGKKLQAEADKFNEEQEAFKNRTNWKRGFFAFTRALQGHLQRQERNYQEQMKEMNRNQRIGTNNTCVIKCMRGRYNNEINIEMCQDMCN